MLNFLDKISFATPRLRRLAFWMLLALSTYVLAGFLLLPPVLKSVIVTQSAKALKRPTSLDSVAFNPLTLELELHGFTVDKREGEGPLLAFSSLEIAPGVSSSWRLAPVISSLRVNDLLLDVTFFGDGRYSISDLLGATPEEQERARQDTEDVEAVFPFALYGFEMHNATLIFDDQPHEKRHTVTNLELVVPFTSSFADLRDEFTNPRCSAVVNGDPMELTGRTLPFHDTLQTEFQLGAVDVDLNKYWSYLPLETPLKLIKGAFSSDISIYFARPEKKRLQLFLGGGGRLTNLELASPEDGSVFSVKKIGFQMERFSLSDNLLRIRDITVDEPRVKLIRQTDSQLNWAGYFPGSSVSEEGATVKTKGEDTAMRVDIRGVEVTSGSLEWIDRAVPGGFARTYPGFALKAQELSTADGTPGSFSASIGKDGVFAVTGECALSSMSGTATLTATGIALPTYAPYLDQVMPLRTDSGTVDMTATVTAAMRDDAVSLSVTKGGLTLSNLQLRKPEAKNPSLGVRELAVRDVGFDLATRTVGVSAVMITDPDVKLELDDTGEIDLARLFAATAPDETPSDADTNQPPSTDDGAWTATVGTVRVTGGVLALADRTLDAPATLGIKNLDLTASNISTREGESLAVAATADWIGQGTIQADATATLTPLAGKGTIGLAQLGLSPFNSYLKESTDLRLTKGAASADLAFTFDQDDALRFSLTGKAGLNEVQLKETGSKNEFAGIDALVLSRIRLENEPYRLSVEAVHLNGPRATVSFNESGRLNVRRAFRIPEPPPATVPTGEAALASTPPAVKQPAQPAEQPGESAEPSFFEAMKIGLVTMLDGQINFTDASVKPTYSTEVSDIKLKLEDIAQTDTARPKVNLSASIGHTPMTVSGVVNPLVTPIYSDLAVTVSGLELVPLSPYTIQYMAYPVERGRLYAQVNFKTEDWILQADNKFFVEKLLLGPKDTRPGAPNIPVKFGLSLLQDGNGNMELNLPIRGRLDDPDFRIGGIVFTTIAGLFVKALASPFSLIGSIFGGGEDMAFVAFDPGRHNLTATALRKLETTITALKERKRLKLEVDGVTDPVADKAGLAQAIFDTKLKQQKHDSLPISERARTTVEAMTIDPDEYEELLYQAYKDEPDDDVRPTTFFVADRQPPEVMRRYIMDRITVTDANLRQLAMDRARAVKEHIISREPSLTDRVFLLDRSRNRKAKPGVPLTRVDLGIR
jgi:Uncharacterized protein involved in outer membrane biogenesis